MGMRRQEGGLRVRGILEEEFWVAPHVSSLLWVGANDEEVFKHLAAAGSYALLCPCEQRAVRPLSSLALIGEKEDHRCAVRDGGRGEEHYLDILGPQHEMGRSSEEPQQIHPEHNNNTTQHTQRRQNQNETERSHLPPFSTSPTLTIIDRSSHRHHQHINTSTDQHINTSTHQHINTSTHHHTITSTHQHVNTSTHQHINTSSHHHINTYYLIGIYMICYLQ